MLDPPSAILSGCRETRLCRWRLPRTRLQSWATNCRERRWSLAWADSFEGFLGHLRSLVLHLLLMAAADPLSGKCKCLSRSNLVPRRQRLGINSLNARPSFIN